MKTSSRHIVLGILALSVVCTLNTSAFAAHANVNWSASNPHPDPFIEYHLAGNQYRRAVKEMRAMGSLQGFHNMTHQLGAWRHNHTTIVQVHRNHLHLRQMHDRGAHFGHGIVHLAMEIARVAAIEGHRTASLRLHAAMGRYDRWMASGRSLDEEERAARRLSTATLFAVAWQFDQGKDGIPNDDRKAVRWYRRAAERGYVQAQINLAIMYHNGEGVQKDAAESFRWYRRAADQGHRSSQFWVANCYYNGHVVAKDDREAVRWYRRAAEQDHVSAQYNLAWHYDNGRGVTEDNREAFKWYKEAADEKHLESRYCLGRLYEFGEGVERDYKKARKWYDRAAMKKHVKAQVRLGGLYYDGKGTKKHLKKAARWFKKAVKQGSADGQFGLASCLANGKKPDDDDLRDATRLYRQAAEQGHAAAAMALGAVHADGRGTAEDSVEAWAWFHVAVARGLKAAAEARDKIAEQMSSEQLDQARQLSRRIDPKTAKVSDHSRAGRQQSVAGS
jgi:TPR repeat protein